jgi:hypothetical protein
LHAQNRREEISSSWVPTVNRARNMDVEEEEEDGGLEFAACCSSCGDGKESGKDNCLLLKINGASNAGGQEVNDVPDAHAGPFEFQKVGR